ncbi:hypothetical protein CRYUN_Cryun16bG0047400 [Craigia yunnanensis]
MMSRGLSLDQVNYTSLMDGFFKEGKESAALTLAQEMTDKNIPFDIFAFNVLINGLVRLGKCETKSVYARMSELDMAPDLITCNTIINAYCKEADEIEKALNVLNEMLILGFSPTTAIHKFLLDVSSRNKRADAILLMHERLVSMGLTLNQMLRGVQPNIVTYNILLRGLSTAGLMEEADKLFSKMKGKGLNPNASTYDALISGQVKIGNKNKSIKVYCEMITKGFVPRTSTYNVLINGFAKVGKMAQARELLKEITAPNVINQYALNLWHVCLSCIAEQDSGNCFSTSNEVPRLIQN